MLNKITINFIIDSNKLWQWGSFFCSSNTFICCQWLIKWVGWGGFKSSISWHIPCLNRFGEYEANWLWLITAALGVVVPSWAASRLQCCCWSSTQQWREAAVDPQSKRYHQRPTRSLACFFHRIKTEFLQLGLFLKQEGHSCKTGNVRYGGTSKPQNWNYQTFDNFVLKFFHTYVIQLEINYGPPLSTFFSPIMEEYNILDVPP